MKNSISKKSQSAFEFITTYGIGILIALAAIGGLSFLILPSEKLAPPKCFFSSGIACLGTRVTPTQALIVAKNSLTPVMYVTGVSTPGTKGVSCTMNSPWLLDSDATITCNFNPAIDHKINMRLIINYTVESGGLSKVVTGEFFNYVS